MQKKYSKIDILKIILYNAHKYKNNLLGNEVLFLYKEKNSINYYFVKFREENFLHFTGVETKLKPIDFFKKSISNSLTISEFEIKSNFTTFKKMDILSDSMSILKNAKMIGNFGKQGINIKADLGTGNTSYVMTLGILKYKECYPKGIIKDDIRSVTNPTSPIIATLYKKIKEKHFNTITYKSKNINIDKLHFPNEIKELLSEKALYELKPSLAPQEQSLEKVPETASKALGKANNKIIESIAFAEVLSPTSTIETPSQNKTLSEAAITKEEPTQKDTITNRLTQSKEKAEEQNQQNKKQQNINNLEH